MAPGKWRLFYDNSNIETHLHVMVVMVQMTGMFLKAFEDEWGCTYYPAECLSAVKHHHLHTSHLVHKKSKFCCLKSKQANANYFLRLFLPFVPFTFQEDQLDCCVMFLSNDANFKQFILCFFQAGAHKDESNIPEMQNTTMIWAW